MEVGLDIVTHSLPHWPLGSTELQLFVSGLTCRILALEKHCVCLSPLVMNKHLGIFTLSISSVCLLCSGLSAAVSVRALTSFRLACCSRFLTSLPVGLEASVSSADQAHLEL